MTNNPNSSSAHTGMLQLGVGDAEFTLPINNALLVVISPPLSPLPLAKLPVEGMAIVNGSPVIQVDVAQVLTGQPGTGRNVVVVLHGDGRVAFRVDRVSSVDERISAPSQCSEFPMSFMSQISRFLPPFTPAAAPAIANVGTRTMGRPLQLLLVRDRGRVIGVPAASIERVDRVDKYYDYITESGLFWKLIRLDDEVLPACPIPSRMVCELEEKAAAWVMIVKPKNERVAWTAASVLGLHAVAYERIRCINVPDDTPTLWYETGEGVFVEIVDPGGVLNNFSVTSQTRKAPTWGFQGDLHLRCGPFRCLLPLGMIGYVLETTNGLLKQSSSSMDLPVINAAQLMGHDGESRQKLGVVVDIEGGRRMVLAVDEVGAASATLAGGLHLLPAVPEPVAHLFDGVVLDETSEEWIYRFRHLASDCLSSSGSAFMSSLMGWLPAESMECTKTAPP